MRDWIRIQPSAEPSARRCHTRLKSLAIEPGQRGIAVDQHARWPFRRERHTAFTTARTPGTWAAAPEVRHGEVVWPSEKAATESSSSG